MSTELLVTMADEAARTAETAVQEEATIRKELSDLRNTVEVLSGQAAMLTGQAAKAKMQARRNKTASALSFVRSAASRRSVWQSLSFSMSMALFLQMKKLLEILFLVEDGE